MTLPEQAVCLYAQGAQNQLHFDRGITRYVVEHLRALRDRCPGALHSVQLNPGLPLSGNLSWLLDSGLLEWSRTVREEGRPAPRVYHVMSPFELETPLLETWPRWARDPRVRTVVTLYDLIPLLLPDEYLSDPGTRARYWARAEFVRCADQVLAISDSTASDAVELLNIDPARVTVIHAGATAKFANMYASRDAAWQALKERLHAIRPGFMLYVGGCDPRKNLSGLIAAYGLLPEPVRASRQLVIACRLLPGWSERIRQWVADARVDDRQLVFTGHVTDAELGALYRTCDLLVFPSLYEGSGLPILEAMSCGVPVVASDTSISAEILGDREGAFDPREPASIANRLRLLAEEPERLERLAERSRQRARDATHTWPNVAERSVLAYERALSRRGARGVRRARLALVTPWPDEQSGIADYSVRLARELGRSVDVDIVVRGRPAEYAPALEQDGVRLISAGAYPVAAWLRQHDRVLYCMGNSRFHGHVYELLREHPGAVLLHDVQLTGFFGWYARCERPDDHAGRLAERVEEHYATRVPLPELRDGPLTPLRQAALGIYMTAEIQRFAERLFVHSRLAENVLELDAGVSGRRPPVSLMPFGFPPAQADGVRSTAARRPLVVHMGVVSELKGIAALIDAFAHISARHPGARLIIAGPAEEPELARWRAFAHRHAPDASVEIPGHVSTDRYRELLKEADLAVQLRTVSNGEASAAVCDCLAAGVPTIVTELGWMGELPRSAVAHVPHGVQPELLAERMEELILDTPERIALSTGALAHARERTFERVAADYIEALALA